MSDQRAHQAFVEQQRKRLDALRKQLAGTESARHAQERTLRSERGGEAREHEDDAQDMAARDVDEAVHRVDERRLRAVDRALKKIEEGTYGLSDVSGKPIPTPRLEAVPEATLTVQEEEEAERRQRR
jgi:RNA polymerase-binding transcription factor